MHMPLTVILPQQTTSQIGIQTTEQAEEYRVLWLLHGLSDDHTIWLRRTRIDYYAEKHGIAVIMPCVHRSFYQDTTSGLRYFNYVCDELPKLCRRMFRISKKREDNFVAGNSMGGYGAFRCALWRHDRFAAAYSFSGALDITRVPARTVMSPAECATVFHDPQNLQESESDLFHLLDEHKRNDVQLPRLYACCGADDFLVDHNRAFNEHAKRMGIEMNYLEDAGTHDWDYWENHLEAAIKTLLGKE